MIRVFRGRMDYTRRLDAWTALYLHVSVALPYLLLVPSYDNDELTLGTMYMLFHCLGGCKEVLDFLIVRRVAHPNSVFFAGACINLLSTKLTLVFEEVEEMSLNAFVWCYRHRRTRRAGRRPS